jgi:hypothetical protein
MTSTSEHALSLHSDRCKSLGVRHTARLILVCFDDSDITIQSSDGVVFRLHQANLKISMGSWEFAEAKRDEVVQLPEKSVILDLLFQFCYPERHPELNDLAFDILAELAEAVEKYKVFSAIDICRIGMKCVLQHLCQLIVLTVTDNGT